jgi:2-oxoglutarate ferredoxin oxidoreductase subunit gamma
MIEKIIIAGSGGQGVVLAGSLLANTSLVQGLETCGMVSYGVEMRGGTANSSVIISDKKIGSPVVINPTAAIILNQPSLERFEDKLEKNGLIILNTSECSKKVTRKDLTVIEIDATQIAEDLGNKKITNLVMLGAYLKSRKILKFDIAIDMIKKVLPKADETIIGLNKAALKKGYGE